MKVSFSRVYAQVSVTDHDRAVAWYAELFGGKPDSIPMDGLAEWQLTDTGWLQVFADTETAGKSTGTLGVANLEAFTNQLEVTGCSQTTPRGQALATITDPDGNTIVIAQDL